MGTADTTADSNLEVVRRYLSVFETRRLEQLRDLVAEDVVIHGAGKTVEGREHVEDSICTPGLSDCRVRIDDLYGAGDRVTAVFSLTYRHVRSGTDVTMTGIKSYRLSSGKIIEFWGETDLYGLLRQVGAVPAEIPPL